MCVCVVQTHAVVSFHRTALFLHVVPVPVTFNVLGGPVGGGTSGADQWRGGQADSKQLKRWTVALGRL